MQVWDYFITLMHITLFLQTLVWWKNNPSENSTTLDYDGIDTSYSIKHL